MTKENNIYTKLHLCKSEIGKIAKDKENPYFKSSYLSLNGLLDAVEPVLRKNDLLVLQPLTDGSVCTEIVEISTGQKVTSSIQLPSITDPQKLGSAITYFRRYTLESLLGLSAVDDDGNLASKKEVKKEVKSILEADQFQNLLKPENKKHIQTYLDKCGMSQEQRTKLEGLL